jgi:hypothetical protein
MSYTDEYMEEVKAVAGKVDHAVIEMTASFYSPSSAANRENNVKKVEGVQRADFPGYR